MAAPAIAEPVSSFTAPAAKSSTAPNPVEIANREAKKQHKRIEIESYQTENSTTFANPDGKTLHTELHSTPIRVQKNGAWQAIDTTLIEDGGVIKPKTVKGELTLSAGGNTALVKTQSDKGQAAISAVGKLPKPQLAGNTATYPSAYGKGVDLVVTATPTGFYQEIVIRQRPTATLKVRVPVDLPTGMSYGKNSSGQLSLLADKGKKEIAGITAVPMTDAAAMKSLDAGRTGTAAITVEQDAAGQALAITPDAGFLADPTVAYPVTVAAASDTWTGTGIDGDTFVNNAVYPTGSTNNALNRIIVGMSNGGTVTWRGYIRFNIKGTPLEGGTIDPAEDGNADLRLWNYDTNDCSDTNNVGIVAQRITADWSMSNLKWSSQPAVTPNGQNGNRGSYGVDCPEGEGELIHSIENMVQAWMDGAPDYGLRLSSASESVPTNWRWYRSSEYGGYDGWPGEPRGPVLFINYTPAEILEEAEITYERDGFPDDTIPTREEALANQIPTSQTPPVVAPVTIEEAALRQERSTETYSVDSDELPSIPPEPEPTPTPDTMPPSVTGTTPADDETGVAANSQVKASFSEPVTEAEITVRGPQETPLPGNSVMNPANTELIFTAAQPLASNTVYTVEVSRAKDAAGNVMVARSWSFTTGGTEPTPTPTPDASVRGHWTFDEGTGTTAADSSGHGRHATLNNTATWTQGKSGSALTNVTALSKSTQGAATSGAASTQARSSASKSAVSQGKRVEVADETTETSTTYALPDGKSFTTEITTGPVRTKQAGKWVPIDTALTEQDGVLRPKAIKAGVAVEIFGGGIGPFVKMTAADGQSYALRWPTALPKPTVTKNVATFTDAAGRGADLVVTVLPTGFRHDVVLRERPAKPLELRIGVDTGGLTLTEDKGGRLLLTSGKSKKLMASAPRPVMWDATTKGRSQQAKRAEVATDVVTTGGRTELVLKPDHAFLSDPATRYPVRVDPSVTLPANNDVDVTSLLPGPGDPTVPVLLAGTETGNIKNRVHLRFDTSSLTGATVSDAKLSLLNFHAPSCGTTVGAGIQVRRLTTAWDENNLTWANKPASIAEDAQTNTKAYGPSCAPAPMEWTITGIAQDWAAGAANHGLVLQSAAEGTNVNNYRYFASAEDTDFNSPPTLVITTSGPASAPAVSGLTIAPAQVVAGTTTVPSLTPQLAATVSDTVGGTLTGQFEIEHDPNAIGQGTGQIWAGTSAAVASGAQSTATVPSGKLTDGWKVRWRARAVNSGASTASSWSIWQLITIDIPGTTTEALAHTNDPVIQTDQSFTVAAWLRWSDKDGTYSVVEQKGSNNIPFRLGNDPDHGMVFTLTQSNSTGSITQGVFSGVEPPVNEWFHLAGVYDASASTVALYLNGNLVKTEEIGFPAWNATAPMTLGTNMIGDLDEVWVYQRPLAADQINALFSSISQESATTSSTTPSSIKAPQNPETAKTLQSAPKSPTINAAPIDFPYGRPFEFSHCLASPKSNSKATYPRGWVKNGYNWCSARTVGKVRYVKIKVNTPCDCDFEWKSRGKLEFLFSVLGQTFAGGQRGTSTQEIDVSNGGIDSRTIKIWARVDQIKIYQGEYIWDTPTPMWNENVDMLAVNIPVLGSPSLTDSCKRVAGGRNTILANWRTHPQEYFEYRSSKNASSPNIHRLATCHFSPELITSMGAGQRSSFIDTKMVDEVVRCDTSEDIDRYYGGCIFTEVTPTFQVPTIFEWKNGVPIADESALLIERALDDAKTKRIPPRTLPEIIGKPKIVPGTPELGRLHRTTKTQMNTDNRAKSVATCRRYLEPGEPIPPAEQCDEYPFAATYEGSAQPNVGDNYAVDYLAFNHNGSVGSKLRGFWQVNRVFGSNPSGVHEKHTYESFWINVPNN
ncbi:DNRLRE domain-containing protein [Streptosporangium subroseum]|uniref:DNRLRE domain-containing protein n=1 Tax=Streptosporangium subroseum TaxID=106412 RepID=UPI0030887BBE|nr:DNRLRE domain-containing protein [Streptosporangium subroseum]